jgi:creatinine amidohydrolase
MSDAPRTWTAATSGEIAAAAARLVVVPVGANEQHGPHLPLDTDTVLATAVAEAVVAQTPDTLLGPVLALGCSSHHMAFPGTVSLRVSTFVDTVVDVARSIAATGRTVLLLNGHGGNRAPLDVALIALADEGIRAWALTYWTLLEDVVVEALGDDADTACGHAGALETALMSHLRPEAVRAAQIPAGPTPPAWPDPHMFSTDAARVVRPFDQISPDGVIGRPALATPELGARLFAVAVERCALIAARILESSA